MHVAVSTNVQICFIYTNTYEYDTLLNSNDLVRRLQSKFSGEIKYHIIIIVSKQCNENHTLTMVSFY